MYFFINAEAIMVLPDIMKMYHSIDATEAVENGWQQNKVFESSLCRS